MPLQSEVISRRAVKMDEARMAVNFGKLPELLGPMGAS
jgi:hypothetical protein